MKSKKLIFFVIIFAVIALVGAKFFNFNNQNYVIKINEEKINEEEFLTYLFEQKKVFEETGGSDIWETDFDGVNAMEVAKQNALNSIILVKISVLNAKKLNITLTDEEDKLIVEKANELYTEVNSMSDINLSLETAIKITRETKIEQKVFDYITHNFELSEIDFETYFEEYFLTNKKYLTTIYADIFFLNKSIENSENIINNIYNSLLENEETSSIKSAYKDADILENILLNELNFEEKVENKIYNLDENSLSEIIEVSSGYYIFKILSIDVENIDELKEKVENEYILNKKQSIYKEQAENWSNEVTIEKNQEAWDEITIDF